MVAPAMSQMRLDRPKTANLRPSASVAVMQGPRGDSAHSGSLHNVDGFTGAGQSGGQRSGPGSRRGSGGARMGVLQAFRGDVYQAGSDDDDDDEEGDEANAVVDSQGDGTTTPRKKLSATAAALATSKSTILTPRNRKQGTLVGTGALAGVGASAGEEPTPRGLPSADAAAHAPRPAAMVSAAPAAAQPPPTGPAGVTADTISARLRNARQHMQQRSSAGGEVSWAGEGGTALSKAGPPPKPGPSPGPRTVEAAETATQQKREDAADPEASDDEDGEGVARGAGEPSGAHGLPLAVLPGTSHSAADQVAWLHMPAPKGNLIQCYIKRDKSGFDMLYPQYRCYVQTPEGDQFIMAARKRKKSNSNNYVISVNMKDLARCAAVGQSPPCCVRGAVVERVAACTPRAGIATTASASFGPTSSVRSLCSTTTATTPRSSQRTSCWTRARTREALASGGSWQSASTRRMWSAPPRPGRSRA